MFAIIGVPYAEYRSLPRSEYRWLLICLSRYADEAGVAFPTIRQLAADTGFSPASVSRYLAAMHELGVFDRDRLRGGGRYRYVLAAAYRPQKFGRVSALKPRVSERETRQAKSSKHDIKNEERFGRFDIPDARSQWLARIRSWRQSGFWLPSWGPKPTEAGCFVPTAILTAAGGP